MESKKIDLKKTFGSFFIDGFEVALPIEIVQEVVNYPTNVTKVPLSPEYLIGIFNLRGMIVPIINLGKLMGLEVHENELAHKKVAITQYHDIRIGLVFDSTSEIIKISEEELDQVAYNESSTSNIVKGILKLSHGERLLQLIDPEDLIKLDDIPHIVSKVRSHGSSKESLEAKQKKLQGISFCISDVMMAVPMKEIFEIIKVPKLQKSFVNYPYTAGLVNLRGMMIPVIDFGKFLAFARTEINEEALIDEKRIIILNLEGDFKIGLLIDSVENIMGYYPDEVLPMPHLGKRDEDLYAGILTYPNRPNILMVDCHFFVQNHEIVDIVKGHAKLYQEDANKKNLRKNLTKETYISFKIEGEYCFPILDIREIIEMPEGMVRPIGAAKHIVGVHHIRGNAVTLIDLHEKRETPGKVIVLKRNEEYLGLIVDSVEDIFSIYTDDKFPCPDLMKSGMDHEMSHVIKEFILINDGKEIKNKKLVVLDFLSFFNPQTYKAA